MSERETNHLPTTWTWTTLGEVTEAFIEQSGPQENTNFLYVDISSIDNRVKRIVEPKIIPVNQAPSRARQRLKPGDVVVSMTRPNLNAVALIPSSFEGAIGSTGFHVLRTIYVHPRWIYYLVRTNDFVDAMSRLVQGALYPAVRPKDVQAYSIPMASLTEQKRIVAEIEKQFTRLDAAVAALKRVQANLKRYRASVLKAACEGRLVPTEAELARAEGRSYEPADRLLERILKERRTRWEVDQLTKMKAEVKKLTSDKWKERYKEPAVPDISEAPSLPVGWTWASLETVADIIDPNPSHRMPKYTDTGIPFISSENFCKLDGIDFSVGKKVSNETYTEQATRFSIDKGDFVLSRIGTIGKTRFLPIGIKYCLSHALVVIKALSQQIDKGFLRIVISSGELTKQAKQSIQSVGVPDLGMAKIRSFRIPILPLSEQYRIVIETERRLSVIEGIESAVQANLKRAERLRQSILKQAFEGKLVPQDPNDEPASLLLERIRAERATKQADTQKKKPARKRKTKTTDETRKLFS